MRICFTSKNPNYAFHVFDFNKDSLQSIKLDKDLTDNHYGITWDSHNLYVGSQGQGKILVYNKNFEFQGILLDGLGDNMHQILHYNEKLYMVMTAKECLQIYDLKKNRFTYLDLLTNRRRRNPKQDADKHHFNSVLISTGKLYASAHNYDEPSFIDVYSYPRLKFLETIPNLGSKIHNIAIKEAIWTVDSIGSRRIISTSGDSIGVSANNHHFVKGLSMTDNTICTAYCKSHMPPHAYKRIGCTAHLVWFSPNGKMVKLKLKKFGQINEIRCLDQFDYAHGIKPFLAS